MDAGEAEVLPPGGGPSDDPLIRLLASLMDTTFRLPGTRFRFGLDPLIGLFPGVGDTASALVSVFLVALSARYGLPKIVLLRMAVNVLLNAGLGAIPFAGDAFSFWFKSNALNYELLRKHAGPRRASTGGDWLFVGGLLAGVLLLLFLVIAGTAAVLSALWHLGGR